MPPRGSSKKAAASPAQAAAVPKAEGAGAGCQPEDETKVYAMNAAHYARVQEAMNILKTTPGMAGVETALPLEEGATMAPLNEEAMVARLSAGEQYVCGASAFFAKPLTDASPGVPHRHL